MGSLQFGTHSRPRDRNQPQPFREWIGSVKLRRCTTVVCKVLYVARPDYDPTTSTVSSTEIFATGFFARIVAITTTLVNTNRVPSMVPKPSA